MYVINVALLLLFVSVFSKAQLELVLLEVSHSLIAVGAVVYVCVGGEVRVSLYLGHS